MDQYIVMKVNHFKKVYTNKYRINHIHIIVQKK